MKNLSRKTSTYSIVINLITIILFFAPFAVLKRNAVSIPTYTNLSGFQALNCEFGTNIPVLVILCLIGAATLLEVLALSFKPVSLLTCLFEIGAGVLMFVMVPFVKANTSTWAFPLMTYEVSIGAGAVIDGCLLCISGIVSFANLFTKTEQKQ